jgi:hypothetical protein
MGHEWPLRQGSRENAAFSPQSADVCHDGSIILNLLSLLGSWRFPKAPGAPMRSLFALVSCASIVAASAAFAETRVFIIANQADGYGVDQCLAKGDKCGAQVAPIASHGILPRLRPIAGSIPTKLPALSPKPAQTAPMAIATNMSQSPASAEFPRSWRTLGAVSGP